ncbi:phosphosulfolactate synthase, partial [bacterium]|nr:phosphosulfolactate synthase [bacterium]
EVVERSHINVTLKQLKLDQYIDKCKTEGFDYLEDIRTLSVDELIKYIGMLRGHAMRLFNHFKNDN